MGWSDDRIIGLLELDDAVHDLLEEVRAMQILERTARLMSSMS